MSKKKSVRVFVSFVTPFLYGMERSLIERFEILQPEIQSHFLMTYATFRLNLPVLDAVRKAGISYSFLNDRKDWQMLRKPRSILEAITVLRTLILANRDIFKSSIGEDIFYMPSLRTPYLAFLTILFYRLRKKAVVYGFHDSFNQHSRLLKLLGPLVSHYVFHSAYTQRQFELNNPWAVTRNSPIIPNIVKFVPSSTPSPLSSSSRAILFAGQIAKYKGADLLIEAFLQIKDSYPDVTLHFVGNPHKEFEDEFLKAINTPEAGGRINYWGYRNDVHDFLKSAYIFVQPSRPSLVNEAFGRGVIEAMAAGVPSVCFRSGALPEHVIHGVTGLICEDESASCLARHLQILIVDPMLRNTYAQQAQIRYREYYSPEIVRESWIAFFRSLRKQS